MSAIEYNNLLFEISQRLDELNVLVRLVFMCRGKLASGSEDNIRNVLSLFKELEEQNNLGIDRLEKLKELLKGVGEWSLSEKVEKFERKRKEYSDLLEQIIRVLDELNDLKRLIALCRGKISEESEGHIQDVRSLFKELENQNNLGTYYLDILKGILIKIEKDDLVKEVEEFEERRRQDDEVKRKDDDFHKRKNQAAIQHRRGDCSEAFKSEKRVLDISLRLFGAGVTQHSRGEYISVLEPKKHIRRKLFGEEHSETADSYLSVGATQHPVEDYNSALEFKKGALEIRRKLFGEHPLTTNNNHEVRVTQHSLEDYTSALYERSSLDIIMRLFGEEHPTITCTYHSVGVTQHSLADYMSALKSKKRALYIRWKLFGEGYSETVDSYHSIGVLHIIH
ncbi:hypothetical protein ACROYT_G042866 [Oculina patagonica]